MEYINKIGIFIFGEMANCLPKPELPFILELWVFKAIGNQELDSQLPLRLGDWISPTECKQRDIRCHFLTKLVRSSVASFLFLLSLPA
jgi:hypothetical protein